MKFIKSLLLASCILVPNIAQAEGQDLATWVLGLQDEATKRGVSVNTFNKAMSKFLPNDAILKLENSQPESTQSLEEYLARTVDPNIIEKGRIKLREHRELLKKISDRYGVDPNVIVALWGIESSYGRRQGGYEVVNSLATLAYAGRRQAFFREELINTMIIAERQMMQARGILGSWAGAMGQCQFMPSSYLKYAVDFNGDNKIDIWNTEADVFASIANYLVGEGWFSDEDLKEGSNNYKVIMKWNNSRNFATAVMKLAEAIGTEE